MAEKHVANQEAHWRAVNVSPDFCQVGNAVIPFDICQTLDQDLMHYAKTVYARGQPLVLRDSVIRGVSGDAGRGVVSGTSGGSGHVWIKAGSSTVFVEGRPVARHRDACWMNCK